MLKPILSIVTLLLCATPVMAVSLENQTFQLKAGQIRFKPGLIEASNSVVLIIKDTSQLKKVPPSSKGSFITFAHQSPQKSVYTVNGWRLEGHLGSVSYNGQLTMIEAQELLLSSE